jgi:SAM-dependent methyltransferase
MTTMSDGSTGRNVWGGVIGANDMSTADVAVVRCVSRFFASTPPEQRAHLNALDIGFGTGRHLLYLAAEGFAVSGLDIADAAFDRLREKIERYGLKVDARKEDIGETTFPPASFDLIVAWGVLFFKPVAQMTADLRRMFDLMTPGGILCADFRAHATWFYGLGEMIEPHTFLLDERAREYAGILHHFCDREEVEALLTAVGFEVVYNEYLEFHKFGRETHAWWLVTARKPQSAD